MEKNIQKRKIPKKLGFWGVGIFLDEQNLKMLFIFIKGSFPLSAVSLLTNEERQRFLPATRTFISVLEKDNIDPSELNRLLEQSRELTNLIPDNLLSQFGNGLGGLGL